MLNRIKIHLIALTVILIFCDSHEKQLNDNESMSSNHTTEYASLNENLIELDDIKKYVETDTTKLDSKNSSLTNSTIDIGIPLPSRATETVSHSDEGSLLTTKVILSSTTITSTSTPSNFGDSTTEKLSFTNKSLPYSQLEADESSTKEMSLNDTNKSSKTLSSNFKQQRVINSNVFHPINGGTKMSGQKIEMPQLNDFFDHSEYLKKHQRGFRYGPHFETGNVTNITVQVGNTFYLHCKISLLQDKTVSWVRRKSGANDLELLTVAKTTYSGDTRYSVDFQYPNNWRLKIESAQKIDEATYECQISTSPPRFIFYNVKVNAPTIRIVDEKGISLLDKYYEVDSTIRLTCIVRHISMTSSVVFWIHNNNTILNHDVTRGGISVKSDLMEIGANSTLLIARVNKTDSGNYTCSIGGIQQYTVLVHVLNEESLAELHHSGSSSIHFHIKLNSTLKFDFNNLLVLLIVFLFSTSLHRVVLTSKS